MRGKVKLLRRQGARLSSHEITAQEPVEGILTLAAHQWTMEYVLALRAPNDNVNPPLLQLFGARLIVMHHDGMRFIGTDRPMGDAGPAYVQEWSVLVGTQ